MRTIIEILKKIIGFVSNNLTLCLLAVIALLLSLNMSQCESVNKLKDDVNRLENNTRAYEDENSKLKEKSHMFVNTIEELLASKDSVTEELIKTKDSLKIKDKRIQAMSYMLSHMEKSDTIRLSDTIFKDLNYRLDTIIGDSWYSNHIILTPFAIATSVNVKSEKEVFVYAQKETVDKPKKCWLMRLFQKKHYATVIDVVEKNPYIQSDKDRFYQIID